MAKHDHECEKCGLRTTDDETLDRNCPECGETMAIMSSPSISTFRSFWHPNLGHEPVYIESTKALDKELKERNMHIKEGRGGKSATRLPQTREEALNA